MKFLNDQERSLLRVQHKKVRDGRIRDRIKAVLLSDKECAEPQIAEALLISEDAIRDQINDFKASKKLKPERVEVQRKNFPLNNPKF